MHRIAIAPLAVLLAAAPPAGAASPEQLFEDPLFRRCVAWMLRSEGGALIDNLCIDYYLIPPPSLFRCARETVSGFASETDREICAVIFEEQARKARAGKVR